MIEVSGSIEYVEIDVAVTLEMLEQFSIWSRVWIGILSFVDLLSRSFCSMVRICVLSKASRNLLDKAGDDTALESEKFADVVAEMFQVFFVRWLLRRFTGVNGGIS